MLIFVCLPAVMNSQIRIVFWRGLVISGSLLDVVFMQYAQLLLICYAIQWDMREPDDPGKYLLAIWTPGWPEIT